MGYVNVNAKNPTNVSIDTALLIYSAYIIRSFRFWDHKKSGPSVPEKYI